MSTRPAHDPAVKQAARSTAYVILHNTSEVVTPDAEGRQVLRFPKGAIVFRDGRVVEVGPAAELFARHPEARPHNANGRLVTPGLVDCHTHMIFGGNRAAELQMKLAGASYADIAAKGGGIRSTVRATSELKEEQLEKQLANRLERWRASGCTTVEVKSGYGLTPAREVRLLELMAGAAIRVPARVHRTALVLHALPEEYAGRREAYVAEVRGGLVDEIHRRGLAGTVDVFCDPVGFTVDECRSVLARAAELGFGLRLHAEQTARFGGARLAAELRARARTTSSAPTRATGARWARPAWWACCCPRRRSRCARTCPRRRCCGAPARVWRSPPTSIPAPRPPSRSSSARCSRRGSVVSTPPSSCSRSPGTRRARWGSRTRSAT
jgi:imidazolonepropionase-like amidohydrolase